MTQKTIVKQLLDENIASINIKDITNTPIIIKLVDAILYEAVSSNASDVHIEPQVNSILLNSELMAFCMQLNLCPKTFNLHLLQELSNVEY